MATALVPRGTLEWTVPSDLSLLQLDCQPHAEGCGCCSHVMYYCGWKSKAVGGCKQPPTTRLPREVDVVLLSLLDSF